MQRHRNLGLCFKCGEKYGFGHQCSLKGSSFMILDEEDEMDTMQELENEEEDGIPGTELDVYLNALSGKLACNTITLFGVLKNTPLRILIDTGSTHSYINSQLVHNLELKQKANKPLVVTLADGRKANSSFGCPEAAWEIQGYKFRLISEFWTLVTGD